MMGVRDFLEKFICGKPPSEPPADLQAFQAARDRLHRTSKELIKEADDFGNMVREMRGEAVTPKKRKAKKCTPSRSRSPRSS